MKKGVLISFVLFVVLALVLFTELISASLEDGLVAYYSFEGNANNNFGMMNGTTHSVSNSFGKLGAAYNFNGASSYISLANSENFNPEAITFSAWVYATNTNLNNYNKIIGKGFNATYGLEQYFQGVGTGWSLDYGEFWANHARCNFAFDDGLNLSLYFDSGSFLKEKWTLLSCVYNGTDANAYANNILERSYHKIGRIINNTLPITMGALNDGQSMHNFWLGNIDEVRIWNRGLSGDEISLLYQQEILAGYWKLDSTNVIDNSKFSNNGINFGAKQVSGKFGNALKFEQSEYINFGNSGILKPYPEFSISFWINISGINNSKNSSIISNNDGTKGVLIGIDDSGKLTFILNKTSIKLDSGLTKVGQWQNIVETYDGKFTRIYLDGKYVKDSDLVKFVNSNTNLTIGASITPSWTSSFSGSLQEVKFFNYALSEEEIKNFIGDLECSDKDSDGYGFPSSALCLHEGEDSNDTNPLINPGMTEVTCNGIDEDSDGYDSCPDESVITIKVNKYLLGDGPANFVANGIPIKQGILYNSNNLSLFSGSTEIPISVRVLSNWPDNSIRDILIEFNSSFDEESKDYVLKLVPRTLNQNYIYPNWKIGKKIITLSPEQLSYSRIFGYELPLQDSSFTDWGKKLIDNSHAISANAGSDAPCADWENYYDSGNVAYQIYAVTGDLYYLILGRTWAMHHREDQIYQSGAYIGHPKCPADDLDVKDMRINLTRYTYLDVLTDDYYMWGDEKDINVSKMVADNLFIPHNDSYYYIAPNTRGYFTERDPVFPLLGLLDLYQVTGNQTYLDDATEKLDLLFQMQSDQAYAGGKAWVHNLYDHDPNEGQSTTTWGISPWMTGLLLEAIIKYHQITGDERAKQSIFWALDYMKNNKCFQKKVCIKYDDGGNRCLESVYLGEGESVAYFCPAGSINGIGNPDLDNLISHAYAYGYMLNKSRTDYYALALHLINSSVTYGANSKTKHYNEQFRSSPHAIAYLQLNIVDITPPIFVGLNNQTLALGDSLSYDINAQDESGISCFKVNDTVNFNINCAGLLTNKTALTLGIVKLNISVNDTSNNKNSGIISISVQQGVTSILINQSVNFISIPITLANYSIKNITYGNEGKIIAIYGYNNGWKFYYPSHPELSNLQNFELGKGYVVIANSQFSLALKDSGGVKPSINLNQGWNLVGIYSSKNVSSQFGAGTIVFEYNPSGYIPLGDSSTLATKKAYWVYSSSVYTPICGNNITDTGEVCDGSALGGKTCSNYGFSGGSLTCLSNCSGYNTSSCTGDSAPPQFSILSNQTLALGESLNYNIQASDNSGISCFKVNDTTNFNINCAGLLTNKTALSLGTIKLNISVNDSYNNKNSGVISINVVITLDTIAISYPSNLTLVQRFNDTTGEIPISGSYVGSPSYIEANFNNEGWKVMDSNPVNGIFSGGLNASVGQGNLSVRFSNNPSENYSIYNVGIGDLFIVAGQSNAEGGDTIKHNLDANNQYIASVFRKDKIWRIANDPTSYQSTYGSAWPLVANYIIQNQHIPVGFITSAVSGTSIGYWQKNSQYGGYYGSMINQTIAATNGAMNVKAILWFQGENDATKSFATYNQSLSNLIRDFMNDVHAEKVLVGAIDANTPELFKAYEYAWFNNPNVAKGPTTYDIIQSGVLGGHFGSIGGDMQIYAERWERAIASEFYHVSDSFGPIINNLTLVDNYTLKVGFNESNFPLSISTFNGTLGSLAYGFSIKSSLGIVNNSNLLSSSLSGNTLTLVFDSAIGSDAVVVYGYSQGHGNSVLRDSFGNPMEAMYNHTIDYFG